MNRPNISGNKWVLAGAITYLLEWVAIIPAGNTGPADPGASRADVLKLYHDHPKAVLFIASWCSLVLLGRVLIIAGIRSAVRSTGDDSPVLDLAVVAMGISVVVEILSVVAVAAGQVLAVQGGQDGAVIELDTIAGLAFVCLFTPLGLSVGLTSYAMLRSRAFPVWIPAVGCLSAAMLIVGGVAGGPGYLAAGAARDINGVASLGVPLFWLWMLSGGVFLARRSSQTSAGSAPAESVVREGASRSRS